MADKDRFVPAGAPLHAWEDKGICARFSHRVHSSENSYINLTLETLLVNRTDKNL